MLFWFADPVTAIKASEQQCSGPRRWGSVTIGLHDFHRTAKTLGHTLNTLAVACLAGEEGSAVAGAIVVDPCLCWHEITRIACAVTCLLQYTVSCTYVHAYYMHTRLLCVHTFCRRRPALPPAPRPDPCAAHTHVRHGRHTLDAGAASWLDARREQQLQLHRSAAVYGRHQRGGAAGACGACDELGSALVSCAHRHSHA